MMKVYKSNLALLYVVLLMLLMWIVVSFKLHSKLDAGVIVMLFFFIMLMISYHIRTRITKVTIDQDNRQLILEETKMFGTKKEIYIVDIDNVSCYVYKKRHAKGSSTHLKIETGEQNKIFDLGSVKGWSVEDFRSIEKDINRIKNN